MIFLAVLYVFTLTLFYSSKAATVEGMTTTWTGKVSSNWNDRENWSLNVPDESMNVSIGESTGSIPHFPVITSEASCKSITICTGSSLKMAENSNLLILGDVVNEGSFDAGDQIVTFAGSTVIVGNPVSLGDVEITGQLVAPEGVMDVKGNWVNNGTFKHNKGIVNFSGNSTIAGKSSTNFYQVMIHGSLFAGHETIRVAGSWHNFGSFNAGTSTIILNGTDRQFIYGNTAFYNMRLDNSGKGIILKDNQHVENDFMLSNGFENLTTYDFIVRNVKTVPFSERSSIQNGSENEETASNVPFSEVFKLNETVRADVLPDPSHTNNPFDNR